MIPATLTDNTPYYRVRAGANKEYTRILPRRGFSLKGNGIFKRCGFKKCKGLMVNGVCASCGFTTVCAWCGKVKTKDGSTVNTPAGNGPISHGMCKKCGEAVTCQK